MSTPDYWVTVCASCRCASCWHGILFCDNAAMAGTVDVKASELRKEGNESESYFSRMALMRQCGDVREVES